MSTTRLQAINRIADEVGFRPFSDDGTTGSFGSYTYDNSDAGNISRFLEEVSREIQARGEHQWNVNRFVSKSPGTVAGSLTFAATVLDIIPAGPTENRKITLRSNASTWSAYDHENATFTFAVGTYYFHEVHYLDFEILAEPFKQLIVQEAARRYQQSFQGSAQRDEFLKERSAQAGLSARTMRPTTINPDRSVGVPSTVAAMGVAGGARSRQPDTGA